MRPLFVVIRFSLGLDPIKGRHKRKRRPLRGVVASIFSSLRAVRREEAVSASVSEEVLSGLLNSFR